MVTFNQKAAGIVTSGDVWGIPHPSRKGTTCNPDIAQALAQYRGTIFAVCKMVADKIGATDCRLYSTRKSGTKTLKAWDKTAKRVRAAARKSMVATDTQDVSEITEHDCLTLLHRPNPYMTGRQFVTYAQLYLDIAGICYFRLMKDGRGVTAGEAPQEIYLLPPHLVKPQKDGRFKYGDDYLSPDEVKVITSENLADPYGNQAGQSGVKAIFPTLELQEGITAALVSIMENEGRPSGILAPKGEYNSLGADEAQRWSQRYRQFMASGSGRVMVMEGDATFTPLEYKPTDLAAVELGKRVEEIIAISLQTPIMIIRGQAGDSRAAYETALKQWADTCLIPRLRDLEDFLNFVYLPLFDNTESLFFCFDDPSPDMEEAESALVESQYKSGLLMQNEARARLGLPPVDGGDAFFGSQSLAVDTTDPQAAADPALALPTEQDITTLPESTLNGSQIASASAIVASVANGDLPRDSGLGQLQILLNLTAEQARQIMGSVGAGFHKPKPEPQQGPPEATGGKAARLIVPEAEPQTKAQRKPLSIPDGKALLPIIRKHVDIWQSAIERSLLKSQGDIQTKGLPSKFVPNAKWDKALQEDCQPVIEIMFKEGGKKLLQRVGASEQVFNVFNQHVAKRAKALALDLAQSTLDTTVKSVNEALDQTREAISEGLTEGESISKIKKRIGEIFENASGHRAELIAKTEAARSHHQGLRDAAIESGVVKGFEHLTTNDPCPLCQELQGKQYKIDDALPPDNTHPGCLCTLLEVID